MEQSSNTARKHQGLYRNATSRLGRLRCIMLIALLILGTSLLSPPSAARASAPPSSAVSPSNTTARPPTSSPLASVIDPDLQAALAAPGAGPLQFIVEFAAPAARQAGLDTAATQADWSERGAQVVAVLQHSAAQAQAAARSLLAQRSMPYHDLWIFNALAVTGTWQDALALAAQPNVIRVRLPRRYALHTPIAVEPAQDKPPLDLSAPLSSRAANATQSLPWGLTHIRADMVWHALNVRGAGIVIGSIDTGARFTHQALVKKYRGYLGDGRFVHHYNWFDPNGAPAPFDNTGHGTHTLGTIAGDDGAGQTIGIAPGATWIAAKGCAANWCSETDLALAGQWMLAPTRLDGMYPDPSRRPHIVNNSWGADAWDPFYQAIVLAWRAAGIYPVFSLGNSGPACGTAGSPGTYSTALGVGATDSNDQIAAFSSRGPSRDPLTPAAIKPELSAPGVAIRSALAGRDDEYGTLSGTSMAAPHVAGAIALMWSASPSLIGQIISTTHILTSTTRRIANTVNCGEGLSKVPNHTFGWGRLDAYSATLRAITSTPASGILVARTVISETSAPAPAVRLRLDTATGRWLEGPTDGQGELSLRAPTGTYLLRAEHPALRSTQLAVTLSAGVTTSIVISLSPRTQWTIQGATRDAQNGLPVRATVRATSPDLPEELITYSERASGAYSLTAPGGISLSIRVEALGYQITQTMLLTPDENDGANNLIEQNFELLSHDCLNHPALCSQLAIRPLSEIDWPPATGISWLVVNGDTAYVGSGKNLLSIDIGAPGQPRILSTTPISVADTLQWEYSQAAITEDKLIVLRDLLETSGYALHLFTLNPPSAPQSVATITSSNNFDGRMFAYRGHVYVPEAGNGWRIFSTTTTSITPLRLAGDALFKHTVLSVSRLGSGVMAHIIEPDQTGGTILAVSLDQPDAPIVRDIYRSSQWIIAMHAQDGYVYSAEEAVDFWRVLKPIRVSAGLTFTLRPPSTWLTREYMIALSGWPGHLATVNWQTVSWLSLANPDKPAVLSEIAITDLQSGWPSDVVAAPHRTVWHDGQTLYTIDTGNPAQPSLLPPLQIPSVRIDTQRDIAQYGRQVFALSNGRLERFYLDQGVMPRPTTPVSEVVDAEQFILRTSMPVTGAAPHYHLFYTSRSHQGKLLSVELVGEQVIGQNNLDLNPPDGIAPIQSLHEHNGVVFAVSEWPTPTLHAISFVNPQSPVVLARYTLPIGAGVIAWAGPRLFITTPPAENSPCTDLRLTIVLLDDPSLPTLGGSTATYACLRNGLGLAHNGWLFTQDGSDLGALRVFSVGNPLAPQLMLTTTQTADPHTVLGDRLFTRKHRQDPALVAHGLTHLPELISLPVSPTLADFFSHVTWIAGDFVWHNLAQVDGRAIVYGMSVSTQARPDQPWRLESVGERNGAPHTRLDIPAGAWSMLTPITYSPGLPLDGGSPDQTGLIHIGRVFTVSADAPPQRPLSLTLTYIEEELGNVPEGTLGLYRWDQAEQRWQAEADSRLDTEHNQIVARIEQLGVFAVLGTPHRAYVPIVSHETDTSNRPVTCHMLSANGGFESGPPGIPWRISAAANDPLIYQSARRSGTWGLWLGARTSYIDTAWQSIELPQQATTATLTLWWRMSTNETTTTTAYDVARIGLRDETGAWLSAPISVTNLSTRNTWTAASAVIDVSARAGSRVNLTLSGSNNGSKTTSWFVDDVALHVCARQDGWARPARR